MEFALTKVYTKFVSNFADNTVSAMRLSNNVIFSTLEAWKPLLQQRIFNLQLRRRIPSKENCGHGSFKRFFVTQSKALG